MSLAASAGGLSWLPSSTAGLGLCRVTHRSAAAVTRERAFCFLLRSQEALVHAGRAEQAPPPTLCGYFKGVIENPRRTCSWSELRPQTLPASRWPTAGNVLKWPSGARVCRGLPPTPISALWQLPRCFGEIVPASGLCLCPSFGKPVRPRLDTVCAHPAPQTVYSPLGRHWAVSNPPPTLPRSP